MSSLSGHIRRGNRGCRYRCRGVVLATRHQVTLHGRIIRDVPYHRVLPVFPVFPVLPVFPVPRSTPHCSINISNLSFIALHCSAVLKLGARMMFSMSFISADVALFAYDALTVSSCIRACFNTRSRAVASSSMLGRT